MSEPTEHSVCDLTLLMRTRLMCGLYNRRAVAPRWRRLAQAYCVTVALAFLAYSYYFLSKSKEVLKQLHWAIHVIEYILAMLFSLWTGDEYINKFFTQNPITDITLDSREVFNRLQKQMKKTYFFVFPFYHVVIFLLNVLLWLQIGVIGFATLVIPAILLQLISTYASSTKFLVTALFNARLLVLRRRLQRYGFRTVGRRHPPPYCEIYDEILQDLHATDNPLKLMLFFELINGCLKTIIYLTLSLYFKVWQGYGGNSYTALLTCYHCLAITKILVCSFGHIALLESAAVHCESMAVFTATQLIKNPTAQERRLMLELLEALERSGGQYHVVRALPLDARFLLAILGFCSAQVFVFVQTINANN